MTSMVDTSAGTNCRSDIIPLQSYVPAYRLGLTRLCASESRFRLRRMVCPLAPCQNRGALAWIGFVAVVFDQASHEFGVSALRQSQSTVKGVRIRKIAFGVNVRQIGDCVTHVDAWRPTWGN